MIGHDFAEALRADLRRINDRLGALAEERRELETLRDHYLGVLRFREGVEQRIQALPATVETQIVVEAKARGRTTAGSMTTKVIKWMLASGGEIFIKDIPPELGKRIRVVGALSDLRKKGKVERIGPKNARERREGETIYRLLKA